MKSFKPNPNYSIEVFDDILSTSQINQIYTFLSNSCYSYTNYDNTSSIYPKLYNNFVSNGECKQEWVNTFHSMMNSISNFIDPTFLTKCLSTLKMQVNVSNLVTVDEAHKDLPPEVSGYTILYYANEKWDLNYGGETLFYNNKEIISAVKIKPGRFVLFDSRLTHSARPPQRHCPYNRYTIATKFRTDLLVP